MLLEQHPKSTTAVRIPEPNFASFSEFNDTSFADRYDIFCTRLVRERLYDSACLILSSEDGGLEGEFSEPNPELSFFNFVTSLQGKIRTTVQRLNRRDSKQTD
jgi:hypothetical protein